MTISLSDFFPATKTPKDPLGNLFQGFKSPKIMINVYRTSRNKNKKLSHSGGWEGEVNTVCCYTFHISFIEIFQYSVMPSYYTDVMVLRVGVT